MTTLDERHEGETNSTAVHMPHATRHSPLRKLIREPLLHFLVIGAGPLLSIPCKYKDFRPKRSLQKYYEQMGLRFDYEEVFKFAKQNMGLGGTSEFIGMDKKQYLTKVF